MDVSRPYMEIYTLMYENVMCMYVQALLLNNVQMIILVYFFQYFSGEIFCEEALHERNAFE